MIKRRFLYAADGTGGGGGAASPPADSPAPGSAPAADTAPPAESETIPKEGDDPWKGTWIAQLPQEAREKHKDRLMGLKGKHLAEVLDEHFSQADRMQGAIIPPGTDAAPEEVKAFLQKMGIPENPEGYELDSKLIGDTDGNFTKTFADNLARIGLTKKQGQMVYAQIAALYKTGQEGQKKLRSEIEGSFERRLKEDFAGDEAKAAETKDWFKRWMVSLADKQLVRDLADSGIAFNTTFAKTMAETHRKHTAEMPYIGGRDGAKENPGAFQVSPQFEERYGRRN
jgi:hypothetical protein